MADREWVDPETGEVFALIGLAQWNKIVELAVHVAPCGPGYDCGAFGCALARHVLAEGRAQATQETGIRTITHINVTLGVYEGDDWPESDDLYRSFVAARLRASYPAAELDISTGADTRVFAHGGHGQDSKVSDELTRFAREEWWEEFCASFTPAQTTQAQTTQETGMDKPICTITLTARVINDGGRIVVMYEVSDGIGSAGLSPLRRAVEEFARTLRAWMPQDSFEVPEL